MKRGKGNSLTQANHAYLAQERALQMQYGTLPPIPESPRAASMSFSGKDIARSLHRIHNPIHPFDSPTSRQKETSAGPSSSSVVNPPPGASPSPRVAQPPPVASEPSPFAGSASTDKAPAWFAESEEGIEIPNWYVLLKDDFYGKKEVTERFLNEKYAAKQEPTGRHGKKGDTDDVALSLQMAEFGGVDTVTRLATQGRKDHGKAKSKAGGKNAAGKNQSSVPTLPKTPRKAKQGVARFAGGAARRKQQQAKAQQQKAAALSPEQLLGNSSNPQPPQTEDSSSYAVAEEEHDEYAEEDLDQEPTSQYQSQQVDPLPPIA